MMSVCVVACCAPSRQVVKRTAEQRSEFSQDRPPELLNSCSGQEREQRKRAVMPKHHRPSIPSA
jgi:hypothetical protein